MAWEMKKSWRQQTSRRNAADIPSLGKRHKTKSLRGTGLGEGAGHRAPAEKKGDYVG